MSEQDLEEQILTRCLNDYELSMARGEPISFDMQVAVQMAHERWRTEEFWRSRLLPEFQAKAVEAVEGLQGWDFDEFANFYESDKEDSLLKRAEAIEAIKAVTM